MSSGVYVRTEEHREKNRQAQIRRLQNPANLAKLRRARLGTTHTEETKRVLAEKCRILHLGRKDSKETKRKRTASIKYKFQTDPKYRKRLSDAARNMWHGNTLHRDKMLKIFASQEYHEKKRNAVLREKNPNWRGGLSFEPYGIEFNKALKLRIRQRDNFECQMLHCEAKEKRKSFPRSSY